MANHRPIVLVGPAQAGKKTLLVSQFLSNLESTHETGSPGQRLWLVPNAASVDPLREALIAQHLRKCTQGALLDPGVQTFSSFADSLVKLGSRHIRPISILQKRFLLNRVLLQAEADEQISYFAPIAHTPGFLAQLDRWIADKKRTDVWAEDFKQSAKTKRDRELGLLYGEYQRLLAHGKLYDAEGRFWVAREILTELIASGTARFDHVVVSGFSDFTAAQYDILQLLADSARRFHVSLSGDLEKNQLDARGIDAQHLDDRGMLFRRVQQTLGRLREVLPHLHIEPLSPRETSANQPPLPDSLRHAEQTLFCDPESARGSEVPEPEAIEIIAAGSVQQELELVAARIKRQLFEGTAHPENIVLVSKSLQADARRICQVLTDHGIPYWIERRPALSETALAQTIQALLELERDDWPFRKILAIVGNRSVRQFDAPRDMQPRVCLEQAIRAAQLPLGKEHLLEQLQRWAVATTPEKSDSAKQAAVAHGLLEDLAMQVGTLPDSAPLEKWIEAIQSLLMGLGILADSRSESSWHTLRRGLISLQQVEAWALEEHSSIDLAQFLKNLRLATAETPQPSAVDSVGRVRVLSAETARQITAPDVYLVGVTEQAFSASPITNQLDSTAQRSTSQLADEQADMLYLFYTLVTRATRSLTISYAALDEKGQQLPPSPMLTELRRCFPHHEIQTQIQQPGESDSVDEVPYSLTALRTRAIRQALDKRPKLLAGLATGANSTGRNILAGIESIASRGKRDQFGPYEGICSGEHTVSALLEGFGANHLWSPSQLEEYARCPFRFFAAQILSLRQQQEIAVENNMGRRGSLLHQVLAAVHQQLAQQPLDCEDEAQWREQLVEKFREALDEEIQQRPLGGIQQSLREIERREVSEWAENYAEQEHNYRERWSDLDEPPRPAYFEVRFGPEVAASEQIDDTVISTPLPFELDLGHQQIRITGQIDRIDLGRVGNVVVLNVIDYKSGKEVKFKTEDFLSGRQLQLPLYALAAEELLLADQQAEALAAGYWSLQGKGFEAGAFQLQTAEGSVLKPQPTAETYREQLVETLGRLVGNVQQGKFPVYNPEDKCTSWCEYRTICRIGQIRSLEKQWPRDEAPSS